MPLAAGHRARAHSNMLAAMTRVNVPLRYAYRLLNHGPTTLVTPRVVVQPSKLLR